MSIDRSSIAGDIAEHGFKIFEQLFSLELIRELDYYSTTLRPRSGVDRGQVWHGWDEVDALVNPYSDIDWAYYWTKQANHPLIEEVKNTLAVCVDETIGESNWSWYSQDFIILHPTTGIIRPHIDTPYRFSEFKYQQGLVGLQFAIPMCDFTEENGATGYVPNTHKYILDSSYLQNIGWEIFFRDNYKQFSAPAGSAICWHPRLLHSTMPNTTNSVRRALLLQASENSMIRKLGTVDPHINPNLRNV